MPHWVPSAAGLQKPVGLLSTGTGTKLMPGPVQTQPASMSNNIEDVRNWLFTTQMRYRVWSLSRASLAATAGAEQSPQHTTLGCEVVTITVAIIGS